MHPRLIVSAYLVCQAICVAAWLMVVLVQPSVASWFKPYAWPIDALLAFWLPDGALLVLGSLIAAGGVMGGWRWATTAVWAIAVTCWYPTLYCLAVSVRTNEAWLATALMVSMSGMTLAMATIHGHGDQCPATIRVTVMTRTASLYWTLAQTVVFWSVFLWILPLAISELERQLGWHPFSHDHQRLGASVLFALASALGIASGMTMAVVGEGTPLPTATAPKLVVIGPYRYVRNPMAVAGILQGLAVGWYLGSFTVLAYALAGAIVWHLFVKPVEEANLLERFGNDYRDYQAAVSLWIWLPRRTDRA